MSRPPRKAKTSSVTPNPHAPSVSLLVKLGSLIVHHEEAASADGHPFDKAAIRSLRDDPEVVAWIAAMGVLLPRKRCAQPEP